MTTKPGTGAAGKADALNRGLQNRRPPGPSAQPLPPAAETPSRPSTSPTGPRPGQRAPAGHGRRGHLRKMSLELTPDEHDRLKLWLVSAFGGDARATPVLKALLAEAQNDPALTERIRRRLESRD